MIYGIIHLDREKKISQSELTPLALSDNSDTSVAGNIGIGVAKTGVATIDDGVGLAHSGNQRITVAASGNIFKSNVTGDGLTRPADVILNTYQKHGESGFKELNGQFAAAIWDSAKDRFLLALDHVGFEPLFYFWDGKRLVFSSALQSFLNHPEIENQINFRTLRNYLLFNYNAGLDAFVEKVKRVRPGTCLILENGKLNEKRYWFLSYQNQNGRKIEDYKNELINLTKDAIQIRTAESTSDPGAFLSGGMDSSSVVGLLHGVAERPVHTFSFRCADKSVDESYFARVMAEHYQTQHNEIQYTADALHDLETMTRAMEEPLCDIGVELGSFIMGRAAQGNVQYILTGDGGDELYAGHPVYVADRMAEKFDRIPALLRSGITTAAGMLPDSDKKKSLLVKARRFAYSYKFPSELLSNRWRIYYDGSELADLCTPETVTGFGALDSYDDITGLYADADGPDALSRSLYGDYQTLVRFHVDRLRLTRTSGVEARFPLHDYRLIEFSATIPSELKINGSQVKYIQKKALEGILPDEIVFRKDKMGHNVPMKNWMRDTDIFRNMIRDVLSEEAVKRRGFFNYSTINKMLDLHLSKKKDYSHRLYALLILELWLRNNFDK